MTEGQLYRGGLPLEHSLAIFLLRYRTTPHTTTGVTLSLLFMGRELCTQLHLLSPHMFVTDKLYKESIMTSIAVCECLWLDRLSGPGISVVIRTGSQQPFLISSYTPKWRRVATAH